MIIAILLDFVLQKCRFFYRGRMSKDIQISAIISEETKELLERMVRSTGLKKGFVLEMALRHHLEALQELPSDVIISPKLVVTERSGKEIAKQLRSSQKPTKELRDLMSRNGDKGA